MAGRAHERVCVGRIGAPHGVRGEVRLQSFTDDPLAIAGYGELQSGDASSSFEIASLRAAGKSLVARFKGIEDRSAAERLRNIELYVPRERLPPLANDEFYYADLIGLRAETRSGDAIGMVIAVHDFGAGTVLELQPIGQRDSVMMPFNEAAVPSVEIERGRIVVDLPEGTLTSDST